MLTLQDLNVLVPTGYLYRMYGTPSRDLKGRQMGAACVGGGTYLEVRFKFSVRICMLCLASPSADVTLIGNCGPAQGVC